MTPDILRAALKLVTFTPRSEIHVQVAELYQKIWPTIVDNTSDEKLMELWNTVTNRKQ